MTDKRELIAKYARSEEDGLFLAKLLDKLQQAGKGYLVSTQFMDPRQRSLAMKVLSGSGNSLFFDGGYDLAERAVCLFLPNYLEQDSGRADRREVLIGSGQYPLKLLEVRYGANAYVKDLTHRDYLGALMNLGIKRETLGDILVHPEMAQIVVLAEMCDYILLSLDKVSNLSVDAKEIEFSRIAVPESKTKIIQATVASLRLDAVVAEGYNLSRSEAARMVEDGKVFYNYEECTSPSARTEEGCLISLRGMGRMRLESVGGMSKKNRLFITIKRFQ